MHTRTHEGEGTKGAVLERARTRIVFLNLSVDLQHINSVETATTLEIYPDLLLSGAGPYSREKFLDAINILGSSMHVSVSANRVNMAISCTDTHAVKTMKLFETMLFTPRFTQKEIARARTTRANELIQEKENASNRAHEALCNELFGRKDRRYTYSIDSKIKKLAKVTKKDLHQIHRAFQRGTWVYTIGAAPSVASEIEKRLHALKNGFGCDICETHDTAPIEIREPLVCLVSVPSKQNIEFSIGGPLPLTLDSREYPAFLFGLAVLGKLGGFSGRLMSTVREKEGLTYSIYARTETVTTTECGYWRIMTFFAPEKVKTGLTSTLRELQSIHRRGITENELKRFKRILSTQYVLIRDSFVCQISDTHSQMTAGITRDGYEEFKKALFSVTRKEVNTALRMYLNPDHMVIVAAGPVDDIKKDLHAFGKGTN